MTDPRLVHILDQLSGDFTHITEAIGSYRAKLVAQGLSPDEIRTLVLRMEERLMGPLFNEAERELRNRPDT